MREKVCMCVRVCTCVCIFLCSIGKRCINSEAGKGLVCVYLCVTYLGILASCASVI